MAVGSSTGDPRQVQPRAAPIDQQFGGVVAFAGTILWVGRRHWRTVAAQAFRGHVAGEPHGRYLSYRPRSGPWSGACS